MFDVRQSDGLVQWRVLRLIFDVKKNADRQHFNMSSSWSSVGEAVGFPETTAASPTENGLQLGPFQLHSAFLYGEDLLD